jgi:hypothetical protein
MLTLTITDPHLLTEDERNAIAAFAAIRHELRDAVPGLTPPATIDPADRPDVGTLPEIPVATAARFDKRPAVDAALIFGAAPAPSVPSPPSAPPAPPTPAPSQPATAATTAGGSASAPAPTVGAPSGGVELDSRGLPWDPRIHASTKNRNAVGGEWKRKKNVDPAAVEFVEAELRALMAVPAVPAPSAQPGTTAGATPTPPSAPGVSAPPAVPMPPAPPTAPVAPTTFPALMAWVAKMVSDKKLTQADVVAIVQPVGLSSVVGLNNRPDLIPQVYAALSARAAEIAGATA